MHIYQVFHQIERYARRENVDAHPLYKAMRMLIGKNGIFSGKADIQQLYTGYHEWKAFLLDNGVSEEVIYGLENALQIPVVVREEETGAFNVITYVLMLFIGFSIGVQAGRVCY